MALVTVILVMSLTLTATLLEGSIAICILEKRKQAQRGSVTCPSHTAH